MPLALEPSATAFSPACYYFRSYYLCAISKAPHSRDFAIASFSMRLLRASESRFQRQQSPHLFLKFTPAKLSPHLPTLARQRKV